MAAVGELPAGGDFRDVWLAEGRGKTYPVGGGYFGMELTAA